MSGKEKRVEKANVRRANLKRYVDRRLEGNLSELARLYAKHHGRDPRPSFFSEVLRGIRGFAEILAGDVEEAIGLKPGQLSVEESPLEMIDPRPRRFSEEIKQELDDLDVSEREQLSKALEDIKARRRPRRRATR